ncbi:F-box domain containing protein [Tanacetum coccineum]|uniref:F-box domain containing protein n=1 Tax=Tanacetum coccineum TaxID=301880 RepID=A0ABQ5HMV5_9ASTR
MDRLPTNIMFDIFSKVPAKCLARFRCVSKLWCDYIDDRYLMTVYDERVIEEPKPILYHSHLVSHERITRSLCFHVRESLQTRDAYHTDVLVPKEGPFLEFLHKKPLSKSSIVRIKVRGSCNGLMCLSQDEDDIVTTLVVVHPLKKECYELPPLPMRFDSSMSRESCGLGFDASTNTLKMVYVLPKDYVPPSDPNMLRLEKKSSMCAVAEVEKLVDLPSPDPVPIALPIYTEFGSPLSFYSLRLEKKSSMCVVAEVEKPVDLPSPDPVPIALPIYTKFGSPLSFYSVPADRPPTVPTPIRSTFTNL